MSFSAETRKHLEEAIYINFHTKVENHIQILAPKRNPQQNLNIAEILKLKLSHRLASNSNIKYQAE